MLLQRPKSSTRSTQSDTSESLQLKEQDAMVVCSMGYRCFRLMNQQQNVRQDGGASESIQELRDSIDDVRGQNHRSVMQLNAMRLLMRVLYAGTSLRVCGVGDRTWPYKF
nr:hypothetical protein [Tanacetum cinerariifolium]